MRNSEQQTEYILHLRDEHNKKAARRLKIIMSTSLSIAACFVIVVGIVLFLPHMANASKQNAKDVRTEDAMPSAYGSLYNVTRIEFNNNSIPETSNQAAIGTEEKYTESVTPTATSETNEAIDGIVNHLNNFIECELSNNSYVKKSESTITIAGQVFELHKLQDLPMSIAAYATNSELKGIACSSEIQKMDLEEFLLAFNISGLTSSKSDDEKVLNCLNSILVKAHDSDVYLETYDFELKLDVTSQNELCLVIDVLASVNGNILIKIFPSNSDIVLTYTNVQVEKSQIEELLALRELPTTYLH